MRERKQKIRAQTECDPIEAAWRDDIAGDVLELWIGLSHLMARVRSVPAPKDEAAQSPARRHQPRPLHRPPAGHGVKGHKRPDDQSVRLRRTRT